MIRRTFFQLISSSLIAPRIPLLTDHLKSREVQHAADDFRPPTADTLSPDGKTILHSVSGSSLPRQFRDDHPTSHGSSSDHPGHVNFHEQDPEWLREWKEIPRLEVFEQDLPDHSDPSQRKIAAIILSHIRSGTPLKFRYLGGSEPGRSRNVLPTWLFSLDYFNYYQYRVEEPAYIPEAADMPIYLHAWCIDRNAPRIFRLDRIQLLTVDP